MISMTPCSCALNSFTFEWKDSAVALVALFFNVLSLVSKENKAIAQKMCDMKGVYDKIKVNAPDNIYLVAKSKCNYLQL